MDDLPPEHSSTIPPDARCRECGYSLRDLMRLRCPECGQPFDPNDATTMRLPRGVPDHVLKAMRPMPAWKRASIARAFVTSGLMMVWGEAALPGGRGVTACGWVLLLFAFTVVPLDRLTQRLYAWRFGLDMPARPRSTTAWAATAAIFGAVAMSGVERFLLFEWRCGPLHQTLIAIYATRPAVEVERLDEWHGPWHLQRPNPYDYRYYGFTVALGWGFYAQMYDAPDGRPTLDIRSSERWLDH